MAENQEVNGTYKNADGVKSFSVQAPGTEQKPAAPSTGPAIKHKVVYRATVNSESGETTVSTSRPSGANVPTAPSPTQATAVNSAGQRIPISLAGPRDVVDLPGYGTSLASVYEGMGLIRKSATGGYEVIGQAQPAAQQQPNTQEQKPQEKPAVPVADVRGIAPSSAESDSTLRSLQQDSPAVLEGIISSVAAGKPLDHQMLAREMADEYAGVKVEALRDDHFRAGAQALANVGVQDADACVAWIQKVDPDLAASIVRDILIHKDVSKLQEAGRQYLARQNQGMVNALEAKGVSTWQDNGSTFLRIADLERAAGITIPRAARSGDFAGGGAESISLREAIARGYITVSGS